MTREPGTAPRWFLLLPLVAVAAWWPLAPYWASDDFFALAYAHDLGRALSDFVGPQYGATDVWWFYRPLITLSFWLDQQLGGADPLVSHLSNVLAHAMSTLLVATIARRFLPDVQAFSTALLWAVMPSHVGSIAWAVGRVDSHTTVWCLTALWLCVRANERRVDGTGGARWPAVVAFALALVSKELAFVVPPLAALLSFVQAPVAGQRAAFAGRATWPLWLLLLAYAPLRVWALGRFGGYAESDYSPGAMLGGLGSVLQNLTVPLGWIGTPPADARAPAGLWLTAAALPVAVAGLVAVARRPKFTVAAACAFAIALAPMASFLHAADNPHLLRIYYLPAIALCAIVAAAGRWYVLAVLLAWAWPFVAVRSTQCDADRETAAMHAALLREADEAPPGPMFVAGMPAANAAGTAVQLHFGVDRLLAPPFHAAGRTVYAFRPFAPIAGVVRLETPGEPPAALPLGSTWWFADASALGRAPAPLPLPELVLAGDDDGVLDLTTPRLEPLIASCHEAWANGTATFGLRVPGMRPAFFRITVFTATGYLSCVCRDHAHGDDPDGRIDVLRLLAGDPADPLAIGHLSATLDPAAVLGLGLAVPTTVDLTPEFPTLIEAGALAGDRFVPTHRARRMLQFRFDRDYPAWVRRAQGTGG